MAFQFRLFLKLYFKSVFLYQQSGARWSVGHAVFVVVFPVFFLFMQVLNRLCFILDELFYGDFRQIDVRQPLFILGFPRSGTTHLHRLIAGDEQFTSLYLWEMLFAPSIVQKKCFLLLGRLDRKVGSPLYRLATAIEDRALAEARTMHHISHFEAEEDEIILIHIFASAFQTFLFPFDEMLAYTHFDIAIPREQRMRIMAFYRDCIKRHLYVFGEDKHYVSKNPAFSCKVRSLFDAFPDARMICMVRTPFEAVPSAVSWMSHNFRSFHKLDSHYQAERIIEAVGHWYTYPVETLPDFPHSRWSIEIYGDLADNPGALIRRLYEKFGYDLAPEFEALLDEATQKAKSYRSSHRYTLREMGLNEVRILSEFGPVFKRFGFQQHP